MSHIQARRNHCDMGARAVSIEDVGTRDMGTRLTQSSTVINHMIRANHMTL